MEYKVGDMVKIINATHGARGCDGCIGVVTDEYSSCGRIKSNPNCFNIKIIKSYKTEVEIGDVWRVGNDGTYQLLENNDLFKVIQTNISYDNKLNMCDFQSCTYDVVGLTYEDFINHCLDKNSTIQNNIINETMRNIGGKKLNLNNIVLLDKDDFHFSTAYSTGEHYGKSLFYILK